LLFSSSPLSFELRSPTARGGPETIASSVPRGIV